MASTTVKTPSGRSAQEREHVALRNSEALVVIDLDGGGVFNALAQRVCVWMEATEQALATLAQSVAYAKDDTARARIQERTRQLEGPETILQGVGAASATPLNHVFRAVKRHGFVVLREVVLDATAPNAARCRLATASERMLPADGTIALPSSVLSSAVVTPSELLTPIDSDVGVLQARRIAVLAAHDYPKITFESCAMLQRGVVAARGDAQRGLVFMHYSYVTLRSLVQALDRTREVANVLNRLRSNYGAFEEGADATAAAAATAATAAAVAKKRAAPPADVHAPLPLQAPKVGETTRTSLPSGGSTPDDFWAKYAADKAEEARLMGAAPPPPSGTGGGGGRPYVPFDVDVEVSDESGGNVPLPFHDKDKPFYEFTNVADGFPVTIDGREWPTAEHYYQAQKFVSRETQERIRTMPTAQEARAFARHADNAAGMRRDVNDPAFKDNVMRTAVFAKFSQHAVARGVLLHTGARPLVLQTKSDRYWGDGGNGSGANRFGAILMEARQMARDATLNAASVAAAAAKVPKITATFAEVNAAKQPAPPAPAPAPADDTTPIWFYNPGEPYYEFTSFAAGWPVTIRGKEWPSVEHYYQAQKFSASDIQEYVRTLPTARAAVDFAHAPSSKAMIRKDWETVQFSIMTLATRAKFAQYPRLRDTLVATGKRPLVLHTTQDTYWGDGGGPGRGANNLGQILDEVRTWINMGVPLI